MTATAQHDPAPTQWADPPSAPPISATDAVVRVDTATPCGTDLHLLKTAGPSSTDGPTDGHEAVGTVVEVGSAVDAVHVGDRLLVSCSSARGHRRTLLHRCRLVTEPSGQAPHATSATPGWTRPPDDVAPDTTSTPPLASGPDVQGARS